VNVSYVRVREREREREREPVFFGNTYWHTYDKHMPELIDKFSVLMFLFSGCARLLRNLI
jgi:hypothetical protein